MARKKDSKKGKNICKHCGECKHCKNSKSDCGTIGCGYFLGVIGAAVYYISTAGGFWMGAYGVVKALLWPAFLVFELLKYIGA